MTILPVVLLCLGQLNAEPAATAPASDKSIYQVSWPIDGAVTTAAALGVLIPYALSNQWIHPSCPCDPHHVNAFDRPAIGNRSQFADVATDVTVGLLWLLPVVGDAVDVGFSKTFAEDMAVFAEVLAVNGALVTATKYLVQRPLPRTYEGDPTLLSSPEGYRSFYSGHTSNAAASLAFVAMSLRLRYGEQVWPWAVAAVVTTSVGAGRVLGGRHFPSDVIVGGLVGSAIGIVIPWIHAKTHIRTGGLSISPTAYGDGAQIGWRTRW